MITRFFREYLFQLVVGVGVTITITSFALMNKYWNWPTAVVDGVLLLSGLFYLMDRWASARPLLSRVRDWLDSSGYKIQTVQDANEFHFQLTDNVGITTEIIQHKPESPIDIASGLNVASAAQFAAYKALKDSEREAFWKTVQLELLRYGVAFSDLKLEAEGVTFTDRVVVTRALVAPEFLQKVRFVRAAARLYRALLLELGEDSESIDNSLGSGGSMPPEPYGAPRVSRIKYSKGAGDPL